MVALIILVFNFCVSSILTSKVMEATEAQLNFWGIALLVICFMMIIRLIEILVYAVISEIKKIKR